MVVVVVVAAEVLGVVVGVGIAAVAAAAVAAAAGGGVVVVEAAAAEKIVIKSDFHIGIRCGVTRFGYGTGMDRAINRDMLSGLAFTLWLWRKKPGYFKSSVVLYVPGNAEIEIIIIRN